MNYDIELNANDSSVLETQYAFTQGDYGLIQFSIRVKADGAYVTNAQRAYIVFTLPNGYVVTGADMSKSVATYTYPFQGSELQVPGTVIADVKLVYTNGQISSNKFSFICRYDPLHDKSFEAGPYISQLQQIVNDGQAKINYLQSLIEILQTDVGGTPVTRNDLHNTRDAVTAGLKAIDANMAQSILLKSDVTHQNENDANKIVAADSLYSVKVNLQSQIDTANSNLTALKNKTPSDLSYISNLLPRIGDINGTGQSINLLNDITYMINTKGIISGCFGYSNIAYTDKPSGVSDWGYIEYFKHADSFVTVKIYPENNTDFYIGRFTLGQSTWSTTWKKVQYSA